MRAVENPPRIKEVVTIMFTTLTKMMLMLVMKEGKKNVGQRMQQKGVAATLSEFQRRNR